MVATSDFRTTLATLGDAPNIPLIVKAAADTLAAFTGRPLYSTSGARDLAYTNAATGLIDGMRCRVGLMDQVYLGGAWRQETPIYASTADRDAAIPGPVFGMLNSVQSLDGLFWHDGTAWRRIVDESRVAKGVFSGSSSGAIVTVTHNLGVIPSQVGYWLINSAAAGYLKMVDNGSSATQTQFKLYNTTTGTEVSGSQPIIFTYRIEV